MNDLYICSDFLANLYQKAILVSPALFQKSVLEHLNQVIGFDKAWWGMMSQEQSGFDLHSSYRYELPSEFEAHWQSIKSDDSLAYNAHDKPRTTIHYNEKALHSTPGLADLNTGHDLRHALCTSVFLPDKKSFLFISLFRSGAKARAFTSDDVNLKQLLTPHLYSSWRTNLLAEIERTRVSNKIHDIATAFVDRKGMIVYADALFGEFLGQEWPSWKGRRLPNQLLDMIGTPSKRSNQDIRFYVDQCEMGGLSRLEIRRPSQLDKLTNREREIARGFAAAQSYKEIAIKTNLSPTTVRHYLRVIYTKLDINDKVELSKIVDKCDKNLNLIQNINGSSFHERAYDFDFLGNGS
jgi:DNA-binding CsgD family transcriptional regulator